MRRLSIWATGLLATSAALAAGPPPKGATGTASTDAPAHAAMKAYAGGASAEQQRFEQFRRDLVNLLALRAEPDLLVAAAELAAPDRADAKRPAALKSPALLRRAQKAGPDQPLVWWISTFIGCDGEADSCRADAAAQLQHTAADNAAAWMPSLHAAGDAAQARAILTTMAQTARMNDFWTASVLAVYQALRTLPVPQEVLSHGLNPTAARINMATGVGGGFPPNYGRLVELCRDADRSDDKLVGDCLAVAHLLENGGTFRTQAVGFSIEDDLLPPGTARDVMKARQRASQWQKQQFLEISTRFRTDEALAGRYLDLLRQQGNELTTVVALLRAEHVPTDPPAGWEPPDTSKAPMGKEPLLPGGQ